MSITSPNHPTGLKKSTGQDYLNRMAKLQRYIEHNFDQVLDAEHLAQQAGMSRFHFHRVFKAMFGQTINEHIRRLRLERSATRLRFTTLSILHIAVEAEYQSHEAFTRAFKQQFGLTPSSFRKQPSFHIQASRRQPTMPVASSPIALKQFSPQNVIALRHYGPYSHVGEAFEQLVQWSMNRGVQAQDLTLVGLFSDDPELTPPELLRADVCIAHQSLHAEGEYTTTTVPGGTYAVALHKGPYTTLSDTYLQLIGKWLPGSGYHLAFEPIVERYLNSPMLVAPDELLTEVCVRLAATI